MVFYQTELLIKSIKRGYLCAEVPSVLQKRLNGESKALTFKSLFKVICGYLSIKVFVYVFNNKNRLIAPGSITALRFK